MSRSRERPVAGTTEAEGPVQLEPPPKAASRGKWSSGPEASDECVPSVAEPRGRGTLAFLAQPLYAIAFQRVTVIFQLICAGNRALIATRRAEGSCRYKMRIAFLSTFYPFRGGIAQFNASLFRVFEREHEIRAFTFTRQYPDFLFPGKTQMVTGSDETDAIPSERLLDTINPFTYHKTYRKIREYQPDLLIMKYWMPFFGPSLGYVAGKLRGNGTKAITILDNVIPHERRVVDIPFSRYFLARNDAFIAMSTPVRDDLLRLRPGATHVIKPHPIYDHFGARVDRSDACKRLGLDESKKTLLFFGFIRKYKGLDNAIRAMVHLGDDYQLVVAGESYGDFAEYQKVIDETGTADRIRLFVRYIDDNEVPLFFSAADVGLLPYKSATQSGIAQIAFHFDLPQIATNVGGLAEIIEDNVTGLIIDSQGGDAIAAKIRSYFDNDLKGTLSANVAAKKGELGWDAFAAAILDLYSEL